MHNLALKAEVAAVAVHEDWPSYVRRITDNALPKDIAKTLNVNRSLVDRWLNKESRPATENVVAFARTFHGNPVDALLAAGYLDAADIRGTVQIVQSLTAFSDDALIEELRARLIVAKQEQPWLGGLAGFGGQEPGVDRDENPGEGEQFSSR